MLSYADKTVVVQLHIGTKKTTNLLAEVKNIKNNGQNVIFELLPLRQ